MAIRDIIQAAAGVGGAEANYIDDVFSTYLYTGTGSTQTITNGIDLDGEGGLVWLKSRSAATDNFLFDTARGATKELNSNTTDAEATLANSLTAFNANGFSISSASGIGVNAATYASWTFRKQAKFFDVVTYTGNGSNRTIAHNLGSTPAFIIVKRTDATDNWRVYHRSLTSAAYFIGLNQTNAQVSASTIWNSTSPTSSVFSVGTDVSVNASGGTYVAYLFAHDAGGFGKTGTDNTISCGSYTGNGSETGPVITLGYEPQWLLIKNITSGSTNWLQFDNMRGIYTDSLVVSSTEYALVPNSAQAETGAGGAFLQVNATGFQPTATATTINQSGDTYIYIAIRRPMKPPTTGTEVFMPDATTTNITTTNFPVDLNITQQRSNGVNSVFDRLRGPAPYSRTYSTAVEADAATAGLSPKFDSMTTFDNNLFWGSTSTASWSFKRATGFFDIVCYRGTGTGGQTFNHNLGAVPQLIIVKRRDVSTSDWQVYAEPITSSSYLKLNSDAAKGTSSAIWNNTDPTATDFTLGTASDVNNSGSNYVAYLFATVAGVSKVGSYTGTGGFQTINCGFSGGARFVLVKRTDATGAWFVWDTARGIVSAADPTLRLNIASAEVTATDYIDPDSSGFAIGSTANTSGGQYIYLAIA